MICGMDIKGNEAIIALCKIAEGKLSYVESRFKKIALDASDQDHYQSFHETFSSFIRQNNIEKIYLKKPVDRGQQTAGANAFRIEALLNLSEVPVISIHAITITSYLKKNTLSVDNCEKSNKYQAGALGAVYCGVSNGR